MIHTLFEALISTHFLTRWLILAYIDIQSEVIFGPLTDEMSHSRCSAEIELNLVFRELTMISLSFCLNSLWIHSFFANSSCFHSVYRGFSKNSLGWVLFLLSSDNDSSHQSTGRKWPHSVYQYRREWVISSGNGSKSALRREYESFTLLINNRTQLRRMLRPFRAEVSFARIQKIFRFAYLWGSLPIKTIENICLVK